MTNAKSGFAILELSLMAILLFCMANRFYDYKVKAEERLASRQAETVNTICVSGSVSELSKLPSGSITHSESSLCKRDM